MTGEHRVFGIRHHGPGSAKSLVKALTDYAPDLVLIEGPPDANALIKYVSDPGLKPPVALLVYHADDLQKAAYFPFAAFSPEWQAMKYALKQEVDVAFMDLPHAHHFKISEKEEAERQQELFDQVPDAAPHDTEAYERQLAIARDPLGFIARTAGYSDSERWWEIHFEGEEHPAAIFETVLELMQAVRERTTLVRDAREVLREAYMRKTIRSGIRKYARVAVVCGAYHAPVLADLKAHPSKLDTALLKGLPKVKTAATWIPWTYERLSVRSGYGAGVLSPAWYALLFQQRKHATIRWMSKVGSLLREQSFDASSAHIIEAVRLADTLATLRHLAVPGIDELREAALTVFGEGDETTLDLINEQLIIGDVIGKVPPSVPAIPLQQDLVKRVKSLRMGTLMESAKEVTKSLDLRNPKKLAASHLFHQLNLLGIDWAKKQPQSVLAQGKFAEDWRLRWKVSFPIKIIEAGMWGNTVVDAATHFVTEQVRTAETLPALTGLIENALFADLGDAVPALVQRLQDIATTTHDVTHLMEALPPLIDVWRYGNTRNTDTDAIEVVIEHIIPRMCIGLPAASAQLDDAASRHVSSLLLAANRALSILNRPDFAADWDKTLHLLADQRTIAPLLAGQATQLLFHKQAIDVDTVAQFMAYRLSSAQPSMTAAEWLEGFLNSSGLLIIHNPQLWTLLNTWVSQLSMNVLTDTLPLLRRTFSSFSGPEREKILQLAEHGPAHFSREKTQPLDPNRTQMVVPVVRQLFGH